MLSYFDSSILLAILFDENLDAIHIATALSFNQNSRKEPICICSFDKNMLKVAREFGFGTNGA